MPVSSFLKTSDPLQRMQKAAGLTEDLAAREETMKENEEEQNYEAYEEHFKAYTEFYACIQDLVEHPAVQSMKKYPHHADITCFEHCMNVAYYNYEICRTLGLNAKAAARGGILHDLFLYDWHTHAKRTGEHFHGLTHPKVALLNASRYFDLTPLERISF